MRFIDKSVYLYKLTERFIDTMAKTYSKECKCRALLSNKFS